MSPDQEVLHSIQTELSSVTTTVGAYGDRLSKIEDAIITLAATQERVNNIADELKAREAYLQNFQNSMIEEIRRLNDHNTRMLEQITVLKVRSEDNTKKVETLETFKSDVDPQIKGNTRFRNYGEKVLLAIVLAMSLAVLNGMNIMPSSNIDLLEIKALILQNHPQAVTAPVATE